MQIFKINQSLSLTPSQSPSLTPNSFFDETALPLSSDFIENNHLRQILNPYFIESDKRSFLDYIIALLSPEMNTLIYKYYNNKGKKLVETFSEDFITNLDKKMLSILKQFANNVIPPSPPPTTNIDKE